MLLECEKNGIIILYFLRAVETLYTFPKLYVICTVIDWKIKKSNLCQIDSFLIQKGILLLFKSDF